MSEKYASTCSLDQTGMKLGDIQPPIIEIFCHKQYPHSANNVNYPPLTRCHAPKLGVKTDKKQKSFLFKYFIIFWIELFFK